MASTLNHHPRRSSESSSSSMLMTEVETQLDVPFPMKLHCLLASMEETGQTNIIAWLKDGNGFKIKDRKRFTQEVMPKFFGTNRIKSFQRNLSFWGFESGKQMQKRGIYTQRHFVRGQPELCLKMKRRKRAPQVTGFVSRDERKRAAREDSSTIFSESSVETTACRNKDEEAAEKDDDREERKPQPNHPSEARPATITRQYGSSSSEAIIQELRSRQHDYYHYARQQQGPSTSHAGERLQASATTVDDALFSSLLEGGASSGLSVSSGRNGFTATSCSLSLPWLESKPSAAAAASAAPMASAASALPSFSSVGNNGSSVTSALINTYLSTRQQMLSHESIMESIAAVLVQQQPQLQQQQKRKDQEKAAALFAAARNDLVIANALRNYAVADEEQKRNIIVLQLLLLLESSKER